MQVIYDKESGWKHRNIDVRSSSPNIICFCAANLPPLCSIDTLEVFLGGPKSLFRITRSSQSEF